MLRAHRRPAVRIPLLCFAVALSGAVVFAFAASVDPSRAAAASLPATGVFAPASGPVSKRRASHKKSWSGRRAACASAARAGRRRREARKACVVKRSKAQRSKPSTSPKSARVAPAASPSGAPAGAPAPVLVDVPPAEALEVPGSESPPPSESPGGSNTPPLESKPPATPVEPEPPAEPEPPVELKAPIPPVEGSEPPGEEEKAEEERVAEERKAREEKATEEKVKAEKKAAEEKATEEKAEEERAREEEKANKERAGEEKATEEKAEEERAGEESAAPFRFFSPTSFWNEDLPADAPLDPTSVAVVDTFDEDIEREEAVKKGPANINTIRWSVPIYTVPANQPTVQVTLERVSRSPALQTAWEAVPLPADAQPAAGTDKHLVVWQPSTDRLWEFWHLEQTLTGWQAAWGGAIERASSDSGAYGPEAWPGAKNGWGASASSLSIAGGLITLEDLEKGQINHALAMALPDTRAKVYASPAQRTDGSDTEPLSLPEGAHLRLDPNLNLAALHLPKLTLMMAEAAQRYGIFVRDSAANVTFYAQDPIPTGTEPYTGAHGYFEGKYPAKLLESFPWRSLELLKMELHG